MPVLEASTLIDEQHGAASRRHRMLWLATAACMLAAGASGIADLHWPKTIVAALWLAGLGLVLLTLYVIHRDSRGPILAAARAWRASAPSHPFA